ncbi:HNH endonuclease [Microbispora triticiradicis]|uniref:HNH endonuclease n=1 Tax=Microbispora triticiradicis TaxID=2200763 RepID=A0ABX9LMA3_9ACTN|nr:HNH endonuclease signature motif containing protein [Microbispora triticiradicis]RGA05027.1 HNH endonuclease [Microbispora triticiradicis]
MTDEQAITAEGILLELAGSAGAAEVAKAGRYLRAVLDPDGHESDDFDRRFFRVRRRRNGGLEGEFYLPVEAAARLQHLLDVYAKPKAEGPDAECAERGCVHRVLGEQDRDRASGAGQRRIPPRHPPADNPGADNPSADHPTNGPSGTGPSAGHPTTDSVDTDPGPGPDPSGTGPSDPDLSDPDPSDDPGPEPDAWTAEDFDIDSCATCADATDADATDADATDADAADADSERSAADPDEQWSDCPARDCPAEGYRHASWTGEAQHGMPRAACNGAQEAEADAPPWAEGSARLGGGARAGRESWPGGAAWAGVGVNSPPPGVWLRGLPGLILATGHLLPVASVHRLARTSTLVRIVMDAGGQVLDMGRKVRLATPAQRRAVFARYATCWVDGCPLPATMCQIDHAEDWCSGGLTDLKLLGPACQFHNRDRYRHPSRYTRRKIGADRWAFTYRNPRTTRRRL